MRVPTISPIVPPAWFHKIFHTRASICSPFTVLSESACHPWFHLFLSQPDFVWDPGFKLFRSRSRPCGSIMVTPSMICMVHQIFPPRGSNLLRLWFGPCCTTCPCLSTMVSRILFSSRSAKLLRHDFPLCEPTMFSPIPTSTRSPKIFYPRLHPCGLAMVSPILSFYGL